MLARPGARVTRPGVVFLRRRPVGTADLARVARQRALVPVLLTALIAVPYLAVTAFQAPPADLVAQGTRIVEADPWPYRFPMLGIAAWAAWCAYDLRRLSGERARRLMRLDEDELECWPGGARRHVALADLVGARLDPAGLVLYVRPPGASQLELVRFDAAAAAPLEQGVADGNAWLVERLRELVARRRQRGKPHATCPRRPIMVSTERAVSLAGDEQLVTVSAGPQHSSVPASAVCAVRVERGPGGARRALVELAAGHPEGRLTIELDERQADDEVLEWFQLAAARFDHG